jgi:hypothetical protein
MNSRRALVWILASTMAACAAPEATPGSAPAPLIVQEQEASPSAERSLRLPERSTPSRRVPTIRPARTRRARRCTEMCSRVGTVTCLTKQSDARILVLSR